MTEPNSEQAQAWNNTSGPVWVEMQGLLDRMLAPFETQIVERAFPGRGRRVLDIGCGAGATTLAMAEKLGPDGFCLGVDISAPLVAAAKARAGAASVAFVTADAQTHPFEAGAFDAVISRFGVMFFDDPVAAFANIRKAGAPGAGLGFAAWRSPAENPFMTAGGRAVAPLLPPQPAAAPDAPGQFAFADAQRVRGILSDSGWRDVAVEPMDVACELPGGDLAGFAMKMGPAGAALREADDATREAARAVLDTAYQPFVDGGVVRFNAACWWVTARA